ncbi:PAS domain-containing protein [Nisaea sp.]|uniref:PAS domain-containing protein n=1 Tax=Nisaea sp. TaxID=2024842 RepID=UPI003B523DE1
MCPQLPTASAPVLALFEHWMSLWSPGTVPLRRRIDPTAFPTALPHSWIYRYEADGDFRCVLAGEMINAAWGRSIKGMTSREIIGDDHEEAHPRWLTVINRPAILYLTQSELRMPKKSERLVLPVAEHDGSIRAVLGISCYTTLFEERAESPRARPGTPHFWDALTLAPFEGGLPGA